MGAVGHSGAVVRHQGRSRWCRGPLVGEERGDDQDRHRAASHHDLRDAAEQAAHSTQPAGPHHDGGRSELLRQGREVEARVAPLPADERLGGPPGGSSERDPAAGHADRRGRRLLTGQPLEVLGGPGPVRESAVRRRADVGRRPDVRHANGPVRHQPCGHRDRDGGRVGTVESHEEDAAVGRTCGLRDAPLDGLLDILRCGHHHHHGTSLGSETKLALPRNTNWTKPARAITTGRKIPARFMSQAPTG